MSEAADQPILILGMHRSGTSYLARLMQSLGVFIGEDLVGPQKGNPRGHFEARPMLEFHQRLIRERDRTERRAFDDGMLVQEDLSGEITAAERKEALELLDAMRRDGPWGWKEPRTCLFLGMWKELLPGARSLVVYRHPLEVHQSLLRRDHWDLALFPDQAIRAYEVYNRQLLEGAADAYIFNANAGFADPARLVADLKTHFALEEREKRPAFHEEEFQTLGVSRALHRLFSLFFPEAGALFDKMQERAALPYRWKERPDDDRLTAITEVLAPLVAVFPSAARAAFVPLIDWWASGEANALLGKYEELAREIGDHIRKVKQWNEEAAQIYEDNKRLAADYERMGTDYAKQQEFLKKQAATQAKVWEELKRTGDSWTKQRERIDTLIGEKKELLEENRQLKERLGEEGAAPP